ncbi:2Fe-2S iron-sulfur cluster-binding protein [Paenibacillus lignilyticus]|uniref:(2Fe-2S)-binding protein n=1 Tax=Paenibacillus lignilyticus TaxID=1172615 RepID=A0ABS5CF19_9BACL|nr:2Fe-2S iron-sulfur cluster-binding protein [Paenibacillus lignilyticus]MBP3964458.1 (2Fe-2S)-binding protein [Paenibacillus lignilyticus]
MLELKGRSKSATVYPLQGMSLLDMAMKHDIDWAFSCSRGTCARCRCQIEEGAEFLEEVTDAEWDRLEPSELEEGYRLGCQAIIKKNAGTIKAVNRPYF